MRDASETMLRTWRGELMTGRQGFYDAAPLRENIKVYDLEWRRGFLMRRRKFNRLLPA